MKSNLLVLVVLGFGIVPAAGQDLSAALQRCVAVGDNHRRLACFDALAAGLPHIAGAVPRAEPPPVAALPSASPLAKPPATSKVAEFGAENLRKSEPQSDTPKEIEEIKATITQVEFSPTSRFIVTLDNGQVWRQIEGDVTRARFRKSGEVVTISHGMLGGYNLTLEGHDHTLYKVRRIR